VLSSSPKGPVSSMGKENDLNGGEGKGGGEAF